MSPEREGSIDAEEKAGIKTQGSVDNPTNAESI